MIDIIADRYGISHRFRAILKSLPPPKSKEERPSTAAQGVAQGVAITANELSRNDIELANGTAGRLPVRRVKGLEDVNHYAIAEHLINLQSLDLGEKCMLKEAIYHWHGC
jgi:hypothetical protein